jgi:rubredoxin
MINNSPYFNKKNKESDLKTMRYICSVCNNIYDPAMGDKSSGIKPGTLFEELPKDWKCPICGSPKSKYNKENATK